MLLRGKESLCVCSTHKSVCEVPWIYPTMNGLVWMLINETCVSSAEKWKHLYYFFIQLKKNLAFNWFSTKTWSDISHIAEQKWWESRSEWMDVQYWLQKNPGSNWLPFKKPELLSRHTKSFIFVNVSLWPQLLYWGPLIRELVVSLEYYDSVNNIWRLMILKSAVWALIDSYDWQLAQLLLSLAPGVTPSQTIILIFQ